MADDYSPLDLAPDDYRSPVRKVVEEDVPNPRYTEIGPTRTPGGGLTAQEMISRGPLGYAEPVRDHRPWPAQYIGDKLAELQSNPVFKPALDLAMFLGPKGAARIGPAATEALDMAKRMHAEGATPDAIWQATNAHLKGAGEKDLVGAFQGKDKEWRLERMDPPLQDPKTGELNYSYNRLAAERRNKILDEFEARQGRPANYHEKIAAENRANFQPYSLPELLKDPELYDKIYPELKDINLEVRQPQTFAPDVGGWWRKRDQTIALNRNEAARLAAGRSVTAHERAHAINDIEGFAPGASAGQFKLTDAQRKGYTDQYNQVSTMLAIQEAAARRAEIGIPFSSPLQVYMELHGQGMVPEGTGQWAGHSPEFLQLRQRQLQQALRDDLAPNTAYWQTAGEVDPRNQQKRLDMPYEERVAKPPYTTEDVLRELQVLRNAYGIRTE